ncbi:flagellar motor switch phosphatase FliY [Lentibacillus saliphilus]|uniref:flagellar motor switch phosphatase FliY n=1 Tax=Lentibacillus saliphilus TaxID=2737028 RepID=UPI001FE9DEDD|nr:flagellar motor switch phosphatase FliY [Lentibacillus saliphilus]
MNDGMLSQDEIDALLNIGNTEDDAELDSTDDQIVGEYLTSIEEDTLGEIGNISFGSSATTLSTLLNQKVDITTPHVSMIKRGDVDEEFNFDHVTIEVKYVEGFTGKNVFVMKKEDAAVISDIMLGGDGTSPDETLNDIHISAVQEAMNQMMGAAATSMSTVFDMRIDISPPTIQMPEPPDEMDVEVLPEDDMFVKVSFQLKVGSLIDSNIMQLIPIKFAKSLTDMLLNAPEPESQQSMSEAAAAVDAPPTPTYERETSYSTEEGTTIQQPHETQHIGHPVDHTTIEKAAFTQFEPVSLQESGQRNLDMLLDIQLQVSVELGRTKRTIKDILDFSSGSIIELDKLAGEPVDVLINNKLIAKGEVVVIDENFGVRITDIASQSDRLLKLK